MSEPVETVPVDDIIAAVDAAKMLGVSTQTFANWRHRKPDMPKPFTVVANGHMPLYRKSELAEWWVSNVDPALRAALAATDR